MTLAKSLAGGMPLSAVCGKTEIMDAASPGGLGGTYAGNALAVAAALAVLDIIKEENLVERANHLGQMLEHCLQEIKSNSKNKARIAEIRGYGSMLAVEFQDPDTGKPDPEFTKKIRETALEKGLLLLTCGVYGNVIRFLYPLTISDALMQEALSILDTVIREA